MAGIALKVLSWFLPRVIAEIGNIVETAIREVQAAEALPDTSARRNAAFQALHAGTPSWVPDSVLLLLIEAAYIMVRLGVTADKIQIMEDLVGSLTWTSFTDEAQRAEVIAKFADLFPELPERITRFILELTLLKWIA